MEWAQAGAVAFALVLVAELGDKTQLLLVAMGAQSRMMSVLAGALAGFALLTALAVLAGGLVERFVPDLVLAAAVAALFLGYGAWQLAAAARPASAEDGPGGLPARAGFWPAFGAMALGELGDKTQLATAALAAQGHPVAVGVGAFLALAVSAVAAVLVGRLLGARVPPARLRLVGGVVFLAFGAVAAVQAILML